MSVSDITCIFRLEFETPVRFGDGKGASGLDTCQMTAPSDVLFSALCQETLLIEGQEQLTSFVQKAQEGDIMFSSLLPWLQEEGQKNQYHYFLPKPLVSGGEKRDGNSRMKKQLKKLHYIAAMQMRDYLSFIETGKGDVSSFQYAFGEEIVYDRVNLRTGDQPLPYRVSAWRFFQEADKKDAALFSSKTSMKSKRTIQTGLYFIVSAKNNVEMDFIEAIATSLGQGGIGGKVSSGLGKFVVWREEMDADPSARAILDMMMNTKATKQMTLGLVSPNGDKDMTCLAADDARYLLIKRNGFVQSANYVDEKNHALKRKSCVMIREGSCFTERLNGSVLDLSYDNRHPVYRLGKALQVGI